MIIKKMKDLRKFGEDAMEMKRKQEKANEKGSLSRKQSRKKTHLKEPLSRKMTEMQVE